MTLPLFSDSAADHPIESTFSREAHTVLYPGDVNDLLPTIPNNTVNLIITSPPYNLGKDYEDRTSIKSYLDLQEHTIEQLYRVLKSSGSLCWQVGNFVEDG